MRSVENVECLQLYIITVSVLHHHYLLLPLEYLTYHLWHLCLFHLLWLLVVLLLFSLPSPLARRPTGECPMLERPAV